jgi:D-alanyl-lipoteichoic acid acyltransferase DltB (MBOAT superfamily)
MLFNSFTFAVLLALTLAAFWITDRQRVRLAVLLVASLVFYGWHHWPSLFLLGATIVFNFAASLRQERRRSRRLLAIVIGANLLPLLYFKYAGFLARNAVALAAALGVNLQIAAAPDWLPLGISFFTFQVVAYQVDVYRGEIPAERSLLVFAVFKGFFAQLIAGPIVRAHDMLPQLRERRAFDPARFHHGMFLLLCGLALKIGVADVLRQFADEAFANPGALATTRAWLSLYAYALQLFADFWGYSTMAVGIAQLFSLSLPNNFAVPYGAESLQQFWRRWHITLSNWFRDYVYIPLGGQRRRVTFNLIATMTLAGLWHGAGWNFLLWGFLHGTWLALERLRTPVASPSRARRVLSLALTFHGVCVLWVFFRAPTFSVASQYLARLFLPPYTAETAVPGILSAWLIGMAALHPWLAREMRPEIFHARRVRWQLATSAALLLLAWAYALAKIDFVYFTF